MKKLLVIAATVLVACGSGDKKAELEKLRAEYAALSEKIRTLEEELGDAANPEAEIFTVQADTIKRQEFTRKVTIQGRVDGDEIINIIPRMAGEIVMIRAEVGQRVSAGQVLAKIDDEPLRKGMEELETAYALAKTVYERQAALWKDSIGSEIQYLTAKNSKEALERKIASMKSQLDMYLIKAPISGTLESVNMKYGQMVSPQSPIPAAVMINMGKLKVLAEVSESYSKTVVKGDKVNVRFPDIDKDYDLTITSASNYIDPKNRTFALEAKLPGGISDVKANMLAKVAIESYKVPNAIVVPVNVIFKNNAGEYLYVISEENGKHIVHKRSVKTGMISENLTEVLEGLQEGDVIVTRGYQTLEDDLQVTVVK